MYYYLDNNDQQQGPVELGQLQSLGVTAETFVWKAGMDQWQKAKDVPEVNAALNQYQQPYNQQQQYPQQQQQYPQQQQQYPQQQQQYPQQQQQYQPQQQNYQPTPQPSQPNPFINPMESESGNSGFLGKNLKWIIPAAALVLLAIILGVVFSLKGGSASDYYGIWHFTDSMSGGYTQEKYIKFDKDHKYTETLIVKDGDKEVFHSTVSGEYKLGKGEDEDGEKMKVIDIKTHIFQNDIVFSDIDDLENSIKDNYNQEVNLDDEDAKSPFRMCNPEVEDDDLTWYVTVTDSLNKQTTKELHAEKVEEIPVHEHPGIALYKEIMASRSQLPISLDGYSITKVENNKDFVVITLEYDEANYFINPAIKQTVRLAHIQDFAKEAKDLASLIVDDGKGVSYNHVGKKSKVVVKIDFPYAELKNYVK